MQTVLAASGPTLVGSRASAPTSVHLVRRAEWIILAFLLYAPALTFILDCAGGTEDTAGLPEFGGDRHLREPGLSRFCEAAADTRSDTRLAAARNGSARLSRNGLVCPAA